MQTTVTISHLEMTAPEQLRAKAAPRDDLAIVQIPFPMPELNRFFYTEIGRHWYWFERLVWTAADWQCYVDRPGLQTWIVTEGGVPAGYVELEKQAGDDVEIVYFGMLPQFIEHRIGGWALSQAVEKAWAMGARRVWVHTCDLDHPKALPNYLARGFRLFKTETKVESLPTAIA
jgi:GNAT superfamily N-acetyltransferase